MISALKKVKTTCLLLQVLNDIDFHLAESNHDQTKNYHISISNYYCIYKNGQSRKASVSLFFLQEK